MGYRRIYKYKLPSDNRNIEISVSSHSKILSVQVQNNIPVIYIEVNDDESISKVTRKFSMIETGSIVPYHRYLEIVYIGTVILNNGEYTLHVYELLDTK